MADKQELVKITEFVEKEREAGPKPSLSHVLQKTFFSYRKVRLREKVVVRSNE
jgi:hypothetical protein